VFEGFGFAETLEGSAASVFDEFHNLLKKLFIFCCPFLEILKSLGIKSNYHRSSGFKVTSFEFE